MRVLYLNPVGVLGGGERSLLDIIAALREAVPTMDIGLIAGTDGPLLERAHALGAKSQLLEMPEALAAAGDSWMKDRDQSWPTSILAGKPARLAAQTWTYARRLRRAVAAFGPDVLHSNGLKTHLLASLAVSGRVRLIWHLRDFLSGRPMMSRALKLMRFRASLVIANSQAVATDAASVFGGAPIEAVYNAIDVDHFSPGDASADELDRLAGLAVASKETIRIGLIATYARWKGQKTFLKAAARAMELNPALPVRFYVVGGPLYRTAGSQFSEAELREEARAMGLTASVGFIPFQQDPREVYRALDVVVHASTEREPYGRTIAEAMACGRAVIATEGAGVSELFAEEGTVATIARGDVEHLAGAMVQLAADAPLRARLGRAARAIALEKFSRQRLAQRLLDVYQRLSESVAPANHG